MTRKKVSKKRGFSFGDVPVTSVKSVEATVHRSSAARLKNQELIFRALWECLLEHDVASFKEILRSHLEVCHKESLYKRAGISRRTLYRMLSPEGNPTLENVSRILGALAA